MYIEVACAVKSFASGGRLMVLSSFIRSGVLDIRRDQMKKLFILKSSHVLKIEGKLLTQLTTGLSFIGVLCTFGIL